MTTLSGIWDHEIFFKKADFYELPTQLEKWHQMYPSL